MRYYTFNQNVSAHIFFTAISFLFKVNLKKKDEITKLNQVTVIFCSWGKHEHVITYFDKKKKTYRFEQILTLKIYRNKI